MTEATQDVTVTVELTLEDVPSDISVQKKGEIECNGILGAAVMPEPSTEFQAYVNYRLSDDNVLVGEIRSLQSVQYNIDD